MKKSNSKSDFKNLKIKRESSNQNLTNKSNNVLSPKSINTLNIKKNNNDNNLSPSQNSPLKVHQNDFKRDINFYIRQSSKPWAEIL